MYIVFSIIVPIALITAIALLLLPQAFEYFRQSDGNEPGAFLEQTNSVLSLEDPCNSFRLQELAALMGIDADPSMTNDSSPTTYVEELQTIQRASCSLTYAQAGCPPEEAEVAEPQSRIYIDVYPNPSEAFVIEGYETFKNNYGSEGDMFDTHYSTFGAPWREGEVFISEFLPGRKIAAIALADFYRIEVGIEADGATCAPSEQDIAALLSDEYLPSLHAAIEELAAPG
ncbi:hypothetical protein LO763_01760 [Glycomyces sp. A-F 0318]|uniref:hypothetical protein n=1 Tax=Glycomyces amatae TaxID=2881355 RepID=UPI001E525397|nr:hypothetical protein [Glycomyces amatae]MCD0442352.1 hypothetical protein [Glycomyces amatae]